MRRLYVLPNSSLRVLGPNGEFIRWAEMQTGLDYSTDPPTPVMQAIAGLFHPVIGSRHLDLGDGLILLTTAFDNERYEDLFHGLPDVAILPNPTLDGNMPLKQHIGHAGYKFTQKHLDAIIGHPRIGAVETDSVLDLFRKAAAISPDFKLRNVL